MVRALFLDPLGESENNALKNHVQKGLSLNLLADRQGAQTRVRRTAPSERFVSMNYNLYLSQKNNTLMPDIQKVNLSLLDMRKRFFKLVEPSAKRGDSNFYFDIIIMSLIILNALAIIISSDQSIGSRFENQFYYFEVFSVVVFTLEYLLRLWTCVEKGESNKSFKLRIRFILSPMAIIDLLAILPFYLPFVGVDLRFLRILRIFRIFRLLKMARYSNAFNLIKNVLKAKKEELLVTIMFVIIILVIVSTLMFYAERDAQPIAFASIPNALWWGVVTLTTIGYGDIVPITTMGKILGGIISLIGIGLIALPSGIIASGYTDEIHRRKNVK